ncbi:MAG: metal ABC transporter permease [Thermoguttaceae bacterium]
MTELHNIIYSPDYAFIRTAFLLCAIASLSFGIIGSFVVVRRIGYIAGAVSHCAFGGIGIGLYLREAITAGFWGFTLFTPFATWIDPIIVAVLVAIGCALLIGFVQIYGKEREDTVIGAIWSVGMAVGLLFLDKTPGYHSISSYLFGDVLLVADSDLRLVLGLGILVLCIVTLCFRRFEAICFDEEFARLRGIQTTFYFQLLLVLIAITVVFMVRVVGIILVIAMLTLPAATAGRLTQRLLPMSFLAVLICLVSSWIGLYLSILCNFSAGPMIVLVAALFYTVTLFGQSVPKFFCNR